MSSAGPPSRATRRHAGNWRATVRLALSEFLGPPVLTIAALLLLSAGTLAMDASHLALAQPLRAFLENQVFGEAKSTSDLLGVVAGSLISVTAFTFSLLLLAVQLPAAGLTQHVLDQFIRRRFNQMFFGFFLGLALYALIVLTTIEPGFNPVISAGVALLLSGVALLLLLVLLYSTLNQMRPAVIVTAIHDYGLDAWDKHRDLLRATRRASECDGPARLPVRSEANGFVTGIAVEALRRAADETHQAVEVDLRVEMGSYVAFQDEFAVIAADTDEAAQQMRGAVRHAIRLEQQRDITTDPAYTVEQLEDIAWTNISSSKQNPGPAHLVIQSLRDLLARWSAPDSADAAARAPAPVVYNSDVIGRLLGAFESLVVACHEGKQPQSLARLARALAQILPDAGPERRAQIAGLVTRTLPALDDQIQTLELRQALTDLAEALKDAGCTEAAARLRAARRDPGQAPGEAGPGGTLRPGGS